MENSTNHKNPLLRLICLMCDGMNRTFASVITFFICLLVFSMFASAYAQAVSGLVTGNSFTYSNTYIWTSSNPGDIVPSVLVAQNDSTLQITVQAVTGSTVTLQDVWTYTNGTQITSSEYDEVNSGLTGSVLAYAGNLTAGQPLFPAATDMPAINDSVYRAYEGNVRLTNHIEVNNTGISGEAYSDMNLYFDQQTGICVEYYLTNVYTDTPTQVVTQHLVLTNSNVWQVSAAATSGPTSSTSSQTTAANPTSTLSTPNGSSKPNTGFPTDLVLIFAVVVAVIVVAGFFLLPKGKPKQEQAEQAESMETEEPTEDEEVPEEAPEKGSEEETSEEDSYSI